jgi:hypothetical protein
VFLACVTGLSVVTMVTASRQLSGAPTCKGRSDVAGDSEIRCQENEVSNKRNNFSENVRSSARAHRNVRKTESLNNIGLEGPARGAPRSWTGHGYLGYRACTWYYAYRCSLRAEVREHTARVLSCGRFLTCLNTLVPQCCVVTADMRCLNVQLSD